MKKDHIDPIFISIYSKTCSTVTSTSHIVITYVQRTNRSSTLDIYVIFDIKIWTIYIHTYIWHMWNHWHELGDQERCTRISHISHISLKNTFCHIAHITYTAFLIGSIEATFCIYVPKDIQLQYLSSHVITKYVPRQVCLQIRNAC